MSYIQFLSHFEFNFVYGVRECSNFIDLHAAVQLSQHHLLKRLSFFIVYSCFLCQRLLNCRYMGLFPVSPFSSIESRLFLASTMLFGYRSFVALPEAWEGMLPGLVIFLSISLAILGLLWLHINVKIMCSSSVKNFMGNLIRIALNLQIALCNMALLTILFQS